MGLLQVILVILSLSFSSKGLIVQDPHNLIVQDPHN